MRAMDKYGATASQSCRTSLGLDSAAQGEFSNEVDEAEFFPRVKRRLLERGSEMERYLAAPVLDPHVDILAWWKDRASDCPCLARIAQDYLDVPATSVPSERVFSGGADLVTKKRGSLNEDTIQACMCLSSWLS